MPTATERVIRITADVHYSNPLARFLAYLGLIPPALPIPTPRDLELVAELAARALTDGGYTEEQRGEWVISIALVRTLADALDNPK